MDLWYVDGAAKPAAMVFKKLRRTFRHHALIIVSFCCALLVAFGAFGSPSAMRAPDASPQVEELDYERSTETSLPRMVLLGAVAAFQNLISPADGDRCGFEPSCSTFGRQAVSESGVFLGVLLTADRLMRCNPFITSEPFYLTLPNGRLYDPVENNLISK